MVSARQQHLDRLTAIDASFLHQEGANSHMHVGAVLVFEGEAPAYGELVDQIRSIDTDYLVGDPIDFLNREELAEVELALAHYLGVQDASPRQH